LRVGRLKQDVGTICRFVLPNTQHTSGAKARIIWACSARLKSCPDASCSTICIFSQAVKSCPFKTKCFPRAVKSCLDTKHFSANSVEIETPASLRKNLPSGAEARVIFRVLTARLKSCPFKAKKSNRRSPFGYAQGRLSTHHPQAEEYACGPVRSG